MASEARRTQRERIEAELREELEREKEAFIEKIEGQFVEEMAHLKAKYGDVEEPRFAHVPPEEWERRIREAKAQRVINVTKQLNQLYFWPDWMQHYFPGEAAEAIRDMERRRDFVEGWDFIIDWMIRVRDELEHD